MTTPATATPSMPALTRLAAVAGASVQKGAIPLPEEIVICPWGKSTDLSGKPVIVNETTLRELAANQTKFGFDEVALDFNHSTVPGKDADGNVVKPKEPIEVASYGKLSVEAGKGIIFKPSSWTPEGEKFYTGRHYRDLSPTVGRNDKNEVTFIHSVALCRQGQIPALHAFSADGLPDLTTLSTPVPTSTTTMDTATPDYRALLCKALGKDATCTDEGLIAAVEAPPAAEPLKAKETPAATPCAADATPPNVTQLSADIEELKKGQEQMRKDALISQAARDGKVIPLSAEVMNVTPLSVLEDMIANLKPGTVPLNPGPTAKDTPSVTPLSAEEKTVMERMGLTEDQFRAAKA